MSKQNEHHSGSPRANKINSLFQKYSICRDENTKNMLCEAFSNAYTLDYVKAKRPSFSDLWCEYIYSRLVVKFLHVLSHPECVTKGKLTAYMSCALYSLSADVWRHYSLERSKAVVAQTMVSERVNEQRLKFADIVWNFAMNMPDNTRGTVVRLYLAGLVSRAEEGGINKDYTASGIAAKLGISQSCVSTHIFRAQKFIEHELRPLGLKMGALSQQRHYR